MDTTVTTVGDLADDAAIRAVLERDRIWAAYALCDLEPPYRAHARFVGAARASGAGRVDAVVLFYALPGRTSIMPCGAHDGIGAIVERGRDLPPAVSLHVRRADRAAIERRYRVDRAWLMMRMVVDRARLRLTARPVMALARLGDADLPAMHALYALWPETVFTPAMLDPGIYYGAYDGAALIAVAGTHTVGRDARIATIGNVFTHPAYRGRGLATAATGAVAAALLDSGARQVVLNVAEDNAAARAAYLRLGFMPHESYWEGEATLR